MRTLIFGAGAVGSYIGAILTSIGRDVTLVARGAQYEALATAGVKLDGPHSGRPQPIRVNVCRAGEEKPPYDLVFITLKAHHVGQCAKHLCQLIGPEGILLFGQNGIPWWYFSGIDSPLTGARLRSLDPDGVLASSFPMRNVVGAVVYKPMESIAPGHVKLADSKEDCLTVGEIDNRMTPRLEHIKALIEPAGWPVRVTADIRTPKWSKLLSNAIWNPLGAVVQGTATQVATDPNTALIAKAMVEEVLAVARSVEITLDADPAQIVAEAAKRVSIASSTLQDVRAGRRIEIEVLVHAITEIGRLTGVPTPTLDVIGACAAFINRRIVKDRIAIAPRACAG